VGDVFITAIAHFGFWSLNPCRIVYVVDEAPHGTEVDAGAPFHRFGFALGALEGHVEAGEERFTVVWDRRTDAVRFDVVAFSSPRALLARAGRPIARWLQRRFHRDSKRRMVRSVSLAGS
jgi:uncharacterized protein (UPF0548 family)